MTPSRLPPGARRTLFISQLLLCCLLSLGGQGQRFRLRVEPQDPVLPVGGSFLVNCTTDCPQPQLINLETSLSKEARDHGVGWAAFLLSNVTDDSQIHCSGYCNGSQIATSSGITVFSLRHIGWHETSQNEIVYTTDCQVLKVRVPPPQPWITTLESQLLSLPGFIGIQD